MHLDPPLRITVEWQHNMQKLLQFTSTTRDVFQFLPYKRKLILESLSCSCHVEVLQKKKLQNPI